MRLEQILEVVFQKRHSSKRDPWYGWVFRGARRSELFDEYELVFSQDFRTGTSADFYSALTIQPVQYMSASMDALLVRRIETAGPAEVMYLIDTWAAEVFGPNEKGPRRSSQEPIPPELGEECL